MRSLVVVTKHTWSTSPDASEESVETVSHYLSSLIGQSAAWFARLVRGHWGGCEIRNHWVRDALFEEDATRSKNLNLNGNLAVLPSCVVRLSRSKPATPTTSPGPRSSNSQASDPRSPTTWSATMLSNEKTVVKMRFFEISTDMKNI